MTRASWMVSVLIALAAAACVDVTPPARLSSCPESDCPAGRGDGAAIEAATISGPDSAPAIDAAADLPTPGNDARAGSMSDALAGDLPVIDAATGRDLAPPPDAVPANAPTTDAARNDGAPDAPGVLFRDDFENGNAAGWDAMNGTWSVTANGGSKVYFQQETMGAGRSVAGSPTWTDYSVEARARGVNMPSGSTVGLLARYLDESNHYNCQLVVGGGAAAVRIQKKVAGTSTTLVTKPFATASDTWYALKLVLAGNDLSCSVDGVLQVVTSDASLSAGRAGVASFDTAALFDDVVVR